jgi:Cof subfamily protein (haloacid dehalogenase superfamily)
MHPPPDKLIALDLDGTLLAEDNSVSPENLAAIARAQQAGAEVVIVTGRPYASAEAVVQRLGLRETPLVCFNGAVIRLPGYGATLYETLVPADLAAEVVDECVARRLHLQYYLGDTLYVTANHKWARLYCRRGEIACVPAGDLRKFRGQRPIKLLIVDEPPVIQQLTPEFQARWGDRLYVTPSMDEYLEFMPLGATKGAALDWLSAHFSVPRARLLACGDRLNDRPLLEHAGCPVAMPIADDQLKSLAAFVPAHQETGVAEAIDWFLSECQEG